eukprot:scaffold2710_cov177-Skeletonema_dohrnii-CCMP3373.AAC.2
MVKAETRVPPPGTGQHGRREKPEVLLTFFLTSLSSPLSPGGRGGKKVFVKGSESALTSIFREGNEGKSTMVELIIGKYKE